MIIQRNVNIVPNERERERERKKERKRSYQFFISVFYIANPFSMSKTVPFAAGKIIASATGG